MLKRREISDRDWGRIRDRLPPENTGEGRPSKSNRIMLNGMLWRAKTGTPWRDLPARFGSWKTAYSRFRLWSQDDVFQKLFESLTGDADIQDASIDSTSCKTHVVECFFNKLKQFRSIATRYDKLSRNFLSFVFLAAAIILLK